MSGIELSLVFLVSVKWHRIVIDLMLRDIEFLLVFLLMGLGV